MEITYDPVKNERNLHKHGLRFERTQDFDFGTAVMKLVERNGELRWTALGYLDGLLHMLCFLYRPNGIRVISLRRAGRKERASYERERHLER